MKTIKVNLSTDSHSTGRGVGFYADNLSKYLKKIRGIELTDNNPDLIHYSYFDLFYPSLNPPDLPTMVTIHDVTPLVLDNLYPKGIKGRLNLYKQKQALKRVSAIITDSHNSKADINKYLNIDPDLIHVTPLASNPIYSKNISNRDIAKIKQKYSLPDQFILYVGGVNPNKNLPRLIKSSQELDTPLIFVGSEFTKPHSPATSLKAKLGLQPLHPELRDFSLIQKAIHDDPNIKALGFVDSQDLLGIFKLAALYCQPSLYEGFGLPVLEAMSANSLVVSSNTSSLPEIYPEGTLTFDPHNQKSITKTLKKALGLDNRKKQELIKTANQKSTQFSWETTAKLTEKVYRSILT